MSLTDTEDWLGAPTARPDLPLSPRAVRQQKRRDELERYAKEVQQMTGLAFNSAHGRKFLAWLKAEYVDVRLQSQDPYQTTANAARADLAAFIIQLAREGGVNV